MHLFQVSTSKAAQSGQESENAAQIKQLVKTLSSGPGAQMPVGQRAEFVKKATAILEDVSRRSPEAFSKFMDQLSQDDSFMDLSKNDFALSFSNSFNARVKMAPSEAIRAVGLNPISASDTGDYSAYLLGLAVQNPDKCVKGFWFLSSFDEDGFQNIACPSGSCCKSPRTIISRTGGCSWDSRTRR
jgi:hypothetical protein